jgi:hypothetical protein
MAELSILNSAPAVIFCTPFKRDAGFEGLIEKKP